MAVVQAVIQVSRLLALDVPLLKITPAVIVAVEEDKELEGRRNSSRLGPRCVVGIQGTMFPEAVSHAIPMAAMGMGSAAGEVILVLVVGHQTMLNRDVETVVHVMVLAVATQSWSWTTMTMMGRRRQGVHGRPESRRGISSGWMGPKLVENVVYYVK